LALALLLGVLPALPAHADGFAAAVSPPRFELTAKPGELLRRVIEITNASAAPSGFVLHTADWTLSKDFQVTFSDSLQPGSCRPWVRLERQAVSLPGGATIRYRFEVQVPADAPPGECRFGILIESQDPSVAKAGTVSLPVTGRIGIIVYVIVGKAAPQLEIFGPTRMQANGMELPAVRAHNSGNAHGRLQGFLSGTDATGKTYDFRASDAPILPEQEAYIILTPSDGSDVIPKLKYPVQVHGKLEWGDQQADFNEQFL
jgi:hypothetical protein